MSPEELTLVDGQQFVQLQKTGTQYGFARLCASQMIEPSCEITLTTSSGYDYILKKRNEIHNEQLKETTLAKLPTWQRETASFKRQRLTREKMSAEKTQRTVLHVPVPSVSANLP